tara:strand:+ start:293 stop:1105 length:813 start_codon:yes stop_codon:yes gene_type:complete
MSEESSGSQPAPTFGLQAAGQTPQPDAQPVEGATITPINPPDESGGPENMSARMWAEKFKTPEDMEKSYLELEKNFHSRPQTQDMGVDALLEHVGLRGDELATNWTEQGSLTDDQYSAFAKIGLSREIVDTFMRGEAANAQNTVYQQEKLLQRGHDLAGGKEEFEALMRWASDKLPQDRIAALESRLNNPTQFEGAVKEMLWDWRDSTGRGGVNKQILAGESMPNVSMGFNTVDEYLTAMQNQKRQGKFDPAFLKRMKNTPSHILNGVDV